MTKLSGWGRYPVIDSGLVAPRSAEEIAEATHGDGVIARGLGRAYGDAAIGRRTTLLTRHLDRFIAFEPASGLLTVEAGASLADIIATFLPKGFFPAVVPGTRFVTVGGAIAADVHGKNHHRDGGFGDHVAALTLATPDGRLLPLSREDNADLFLATIGGMGLTGTILNATIRLKRIESGWVRQRTIVAADLAAAIAAIEANEAATYSVAWIDGLAKGRHLGRSLIYLGEHARRDELGGDRLVRRFPPAPVARFAVPFDFPRLALNHPAVTAFNELYYRFGAAKAGAPFLVRAAPYFFPLDSISDWNRIYGRRGFVQHQCVIPPDKAESVLADMLERIARRGDASFLAVLKKLGAASGLISFPIAGYTLALDFPLTPGLPAFLDELDRLVIAAGGRIYLAKDARQSRATFEAGTPGLARFKEIRRSLDPQGRLHSAMALRLGL